MAILNSGNDSRRARSRKRRKKRVPIEQDQTLAAIEKRERKPAKKKSRKTTDRDLELRINSSLDEEGTVTDALEITDSLLSDMKKVAELEQLIISQEQKRELVMKSLDGLNSDPVVADSPSYPSKQLNHQSARSAVNTQSLDTPAGSIVRMMRDMGWNGEPYEAAKKAIWSLQHEKPDHEAYEFLKITLSRGQYEKNSTYSKGYDRRMAFAEAIKACSKIERLRKRMQLSSTQRKKEFASFLYEEVYLKWVDSHNLGATMNKTVDTFLNLADLPTEKLRIFRDINDRRVNQKGFEIYTSMSAVANALTVTRNSSNSMALKLLNKYSAVDKVNANASAYKFLLSTPKSTPHTVLRLVNRVLSNDILSLEELTENRGIKTGYFPEKIDANLKIIARLFRRIHLVHRKYGEEGVKWIGGIFKQQDQTYEEKSDREKLKFMCNTLQKFVRKVDEVDNGTPFKEETTDIIKIDLGDLMQDTRDEIYKEYLRQIGRLETYREKDVKQFSEFAGMLWKEYNKEYNKALRNGGNRLLIGQLEAHLLSYIKNRASQIRGETLKHHEEDSLNQAYTKISKIKENIEERRVNKKNKVKSSRRKPSHEEKRSCKIRFEKIPTAVVDLERDHREWLKTRDAFDFFMRLNDKFKDRYDSSILEKTKDTILDDIRRIELIEQTKGVLINNPELGKLENILDEVSLEGKTFQILSFCAGTGEKEQQIYNALTAEGCKGRVFLNDVSPWMRQLASASYNLEDIPHKLDDHDFLEIKPTVFSELTNLDADILIITLMGNTILNVPNKVDAYNLFRDIIGIRRGVKKQRSYILTEVNKSSDMKFYRDPYSVAFLKEFLMRTYEVPSSALTYTDSAGNIRSSHIVIPNGHRYDICFMVMKPTRYFRAGTLVKPGISGYENPKQMKKYMNKLGLTYAPIPVRREDSKSSIIISRFEPKWTDWIKWIGKNRFKEWRD